MEVFNGNKPVYLQVVDLLYAFIISGKIKPGDQIPPVRKLAAEWGVNPNTIQKALQILEQEKITEAYVGRGRYVTQNTERLAFIQEQLLLSEIEKFYLKMKQFGFTDEKILLLVDNYLLTQTKNKGGDV